MRKIIKSILLCSLFIGLSYSVHAENLSSDNRLIRMAVYDVGSTSVKFKLAEMDLFTGRIVKDVYSTKKNTENLGFDINESNYMDRIAIMADLQSIVKEHFPLDLNVRHLAVGTAGFRKAGASGIALAQMITQTTGIDFNIINQNDEGLLAYYGVIAKVNDFDQAKDIVWDIGGGSSQLVLSEDVDGNAELEFYGIELGANKFNKLLRKLSKFHTTKEEAKHNNSLNPMTNEEVADAMGLAELLLTEKMEVEDSDLKPFAADEIKTIKNKIDSGGRVYAIGSVHNFVAKFYADKIVGNSSHPYYTKLDIKRAIDQAIGKSDEEIFTQFYYQGEGKLEFVKLDITTLILVHSMMDVFGIDKVYTVNASNTDGLLIKTILEEKEKPLVVECDNKANYHPCLN